MSKSILDINGTSLLLNTEDAIQIYQLLRNAKVLREYSTEILDDTLGSLHLRYASSNIDQQIAAAKALGISLYDYRKDSNA